MQYAGAAALMVAAAAGTAPSILIDYPAEGSVFPPDMAAPTFIWRDTERRATAWRIEVTFAGGAPALRVETPGERMRAGEIDPRCAGPTNRLPRLTPMEAAARTWMPDAGTWELIKKGSVSGATVTITGRAGDTGQPVSLGRVTLRTSADPVGAPVFYRDVPLMPSELEKGVIKPLAKSAVPLIAWRLRNIAEPRSRLLMEGLHTCANCHSFSRDGKTLGMDLDGPQNDKGLYAIVSVQPRMSVRNEDVVSWSSFRGKLGSQLREGFMSQVSPDGRYVVTTIMPPGTDGQPLYYVANFKDYRFLQVFYPTRGILAWYDRAAGRLQPLPGADDPLFVHANAVWSPDGRYLVFARARARDAYPRGAKPAVYANDPNEPPIQYDLYRIPFGNGRGGRAEPLAGASRNGMSNSFPKVSPDGRWIVYVQARNGQLMRPDSQLYIVPAEGGQARRMRCNTPLMNSWHSFSPNGRWMVFSSKSRSPYTQMFLTHLDEAGNDSPAILIENATAANRAVNIPEFVNIPPDGMLKIDAPATEFYRLYDAAFELAQKGQFEAAIREWRKALALNSDDARAHNNFAFALAGAGKLDEAIPHYQQAVRLNPKYAEAYHNLGIALAEIGRLDEAIQRYREALGANPRYAEAHNSLGLGLIGKGRLDEAISHFTKALVIRPGYAEVHNNLGNALAAQGKPAEAVLHFRKAIEAKPGYAEPYNNLGRALAEKGRLDEAIVNFEKALAIHPAYPEAHTNLGRALLLKEKHDLAIPHFEKALAAGLDSAEVHTDLGDALVEKGRLGEAIPHFERALAIDPGSVDARASLGHALYASGKPREALAQWRQLLRAEPNHVPALNQAAWVLATSAEASLRNGAEAIDLARRAVQLSQGREPEIFATLAAAYAEAGQFTGALESVRKGLEIAGRQGNRRILELLHRMAASFEAKTPFRQP